MSSFGDFGHEQPKRQLHQQQRKDHWLEALQSAGVHYGTDDERDAGSESDQHESLCGGNGVKRGLHSISSTSHSGVELNGTDVKRFWQDLYSYRYQYAKHGAQKESNNATMIADTTKLRTNQNNSSSTTQAIQQMRAACSSSSRAVMSPRGTRQG